MFEAFPSQIRLHNQTKQPRDESADCITYCQQSQCKLFLLRRDMSRDGMGRVQYQHSSNQTKGKAEENYYPHVPEEMIPGF